MKKPGKARGQKTVHSILVVILILTLFITCIIMAKSIFEVVKEGVYLERSYNLNEVSEQLSKHVNITCSYSWDLSEAAFSHILNSDINYNTELANFLSEAQNVNTNHKYYLMVIDSNANYYLANGYIGLFKNIRLLLSTTEERQVFITSLTFDNSNDQMVFLNRLKRPLVLGDGTQITHTALIIPPEVYTTAFEATGFNDSADIFLVHPDGRGIYRQNKTGAFVNSANIVRALEKVDFQNGGTLDVLIDSMANPQSQSLEFIYENKDYFVSVTPVTNPDWMIVMIVPTEKIAHSSDMTFTVITIRLLLMLFIGITIASLILFFYMYGQHTHKKENDQSNINVSLKYVANEVEKTYKAKSEFLSYVSHDLRTPLNGIMGMLEIASEETEMTDKTKRCLEDMNYAAEHLYALINDILVMERLENGKVVLDCKPFDMNDVINTCSSIARNYARQKQIKFVLFCDGFTHAKLIGSPLHIRQIILNILSNAIKFTDNDGTVTLSATEIGIDDERSVFRFVITDTGIGMDEESLKNIFEPYWQAKDIMGKNSEGIGLGMPITKRLVEKMNGSISVSSTPGIGSRFIVEIPLSYCGSTISIQKHTIESYSDTALENINILLCEDNKLNRDIAEHLLKKAGANVITAKNGEEAFNFFANSDEGFIDIILMDIMMPVMDGIEASKNIRSLYRKDAQTVPIIAMTATALEEDRKKTANAGMNEHIVKPLSGKNLITSMLKYAKNKTKSGCK